MFDIWPVVSCWPRPLSHEWQLTIIFLITHDWKIGIVNILAVLVSGRGSGRSTSPRQCSTAHRPAGRTASYSEGQGAVPSGRGSLPRSCRPRPGRPPPAPPPARCTPSLHHSTGSAQYATLDRRPTATAPDNKTGSTVFNLSMMFAAAWDIGILRRL